MSSLQIDRLSTYQTPGAMPWDVLNSAAVSQTRRWQQHRGQGTAVFTDLRWLVDTTLKFMHEPQISGRTHGVGLKQLLSPRT